MDYNKYYSIAFSDAVNSACCFWGAKVAWEKGRPEVAFGIGLVAVASAVGTLRFGLAPKLFARLNNILAHFGGLLGTPLIGIGFARSGGLLDFNGNNEFPYLIEGTMAFFSIFSLLTPESFKETYRIFLNISSFGLMLYAEGIENQMALASVITFISAGLIIGPDRHRYILGVRRENLFHYFLGLSMLMFGQALPA
uniref:Uncharacterized protein n=1 Tax=Aplanochytrium stocchinoi TaxID=215587 RepID=A0A7S3PLK5_9STRA|mmetsp:Transcript_16583/g.18757  ORF Transcript_16583/g.18757 Transcript_16583/m.18757 type:complete len:196 (-) Transcript_16583:715-1302(-)